MTDGESGSRRAWLPKTQVTTTTLCRRSPSPQSSYFPGSVPLYPNKSPKWLSSLFFRDPLLRKALTAGTDVPENNWPLGPPFIRADPLFLLSGPHSTWQFEPQFTVCPAAPCRRKTHHLSSVTHLKRNQLDKTGNRGDLDIRKRKG